MAMCCEHGTLPWDECAQCEAIKDQDYLSDSESHEVGLQQDALVYGEFQQAFYPAIAQAVREFRLSRRRERLYQIANNARAFAEKYGYENDPWLNVLLLEMVRSTMSN